MQTFSSYVATTDEQEVATIPRDVLKLLGMEAPDAIFTGVFGFKGTNNVYKELNKEVDFVSGEELYVVELNFPFDFETTNYQSLDEAGEAPVSKSKVLNLLRFNEDLRGVVIDKWKEILGEDFYSGEEQRFPFKPTDFPQHIGRLRECKEFAHVQAIVYPVRTRAGVINMASSWVEPKEFNCWNDEEVELIW